MRALLALLIVVIVVGVDAAPASAESELVVLGPVGSNAADVNAVKAALGKAGVGAVAKKAIDQACASDPTCLTKAGTALGARRVVSVTVHGNGKLGLALVDTGAKLLLGTREVTIPTKKLDKDLGRALKSFVDEIPVEKAKSLFAEGNEHYNLGEFTQALDRYKLAYRVKPLPAFQFNIAQCHRKLSQHQEAIAMYQAYLVGVPDAKNKAMVESLIAESKTALSDKTSLESQREKDRLATEQKKAEEARKAREAEAAAAFERSKAEQARIAADREREQIYNKHPARKWMLITGGLGLATVGVGAYFGVQARDNQKSFDAAMCGDPNEKRIGTVLDACLADRDAGDRNAFLSTVLIGSGAAVVLTSVLVFILDPGNVERPNGRTASIAVSPRSVNVVVRW